jgi:hypothetical protein
MTSKGMVFGIGQGTSVRPSARWIPKERSEGTSWADSPNLSEYKGAKWTCEVENNLMTEKASIAVNFQE